MQILQFTPLCWIAGSGNIIKTKEKKKVYNQNDRYALKEEFLAQYDGNPIECKGCGQIFNPPYYTGLHAHHTLPVEKFPEQFWNIDIIIPVCRKCHYKIHWALTAYRRLKRK